jgi:exosortase
MACRVNCSLDETVRSPLPISRFALRRLRLDQAISVHNRLLTILLLAWFALTVCAYATVLSDLSRQWRTQPNYSHGPLVLPIFLWLLWYRRRAFPGLAAPWLGGLGLLLLAHGMLWGGGAFFVPALGRWSIPIWLSGAVGLLAGRRAWAWSLPSIGFLAFMIPLPFQLETWTSQMLQFSSAWTSCFLLGLTSTFATTDGHALHMNSCDLAVTKDCSGLRMTVATAAFGYVIAMLQETHFRTPMLRSLNFAAKPGKQSKPGSANTRTGVAETYRFNCGLYLILVAVAVVPAVVLANACRLAVLAWVMSHTSSSTLTSFVHDAGDWLLLPLSALLLLAGTLLTIRFIARWRVESSKEHVTQLWLVRQRALVQPSLAVIGIVVALVLNYHCQRSRMFERLWQTASQHEAQGEWGLAAKSYRQLESFQLATDDTRVRHAQAMWHLAGGAADRQLAFNSLAALLKRSPFHLDALRTHLEWSLELDQAEAAIRSAERLAAIDYSRTETWQMCVEAKLRFPSIVSSLPDISPDSWYRELEELGPASGWRDRLLIEVAEFCCSQVAEVPPKLADEIANHLEEAAQRLGSAESHFVHWRFQQKFTDEVIPLDRTLKCVNESCAPELALEVYLAAAKEAQGDQRLDSASGWLIKAVEASPDDPRCYQALGEKYRAQGDWSACAAAYLRVWRLQNGSPLELGLDLAEALLCSRQDAAASMLLETIVDNASQATNTPDPRLRLRYHLLQAELDVRRGRYEDALQRVGHCRALVHASQTLRATSGEWGPVIDRLSAQCFVSLDRYAEAARLFERRAREGQLPPGELADQWTAAARAWGSAGNASAALQCYCNALLATQDYSAVWLEYVRLLKDSRGVGEAEGEIRLRQSESEQAEPSSRRLVARDLAQAWEIIGHPEQALTLYQAAAQHSPQDHSAWAIALARHGQTQQALQMLDRVDEFAGSVARAHTAAMVGVYGGQLNSEDQTKIDVIIAAGLASDEKDVGLLLAAAEWYTASRATVLAIDCLTQAVELQPDNVIAANNLAMLLADEQQEFEQALATIERVLQRTGPVPEFLDTKGWILVQMDRVSEAIPWLNQAMEVSARSGDLSDSPEPIGQLHLAAAYWKLGDLGQAREFLEHAVKARLQANVLSTSERQVWQTLQRELDQPPTAIVEGNDV